MPDRAALSVPLPDLGRPLTPPRAGPGYHPSRPAPAGSLFVPRRPAARPGERGGIPTSHALAGHASAFNPWLLVLLLVLTLWAAVALFLRILRAVSREALWILIVRRLLGR